MCKPNVISFPLLVLSALAGASGCATFAVATPEGYVALEKSSLPYKAVSAEGAVLAVRVFDNRPRATLRFWAHVLDAELRSRQGYRPTIVRPITAHGAAGIERHYITEIGGKKQVHIVALFVTDKRIYCVEATAEAAQLQRERARFDAFIQSFKPLS
ncbi:MAG: hypothetical protein KC503_38705 [Myxococcales bacterium]|nr:hypothetical protein [Myxococcales bacterium]